MHPVIGQERRRQDHDTDTGLRDCTSAQGEAQEDGEPGEPHGRVFTLDADDREDDGKKGVSRLSSEVSEGLVDQVGEVRTTKVPVSVRSARVESDSVSYRAGRYGDTSPQATSRPFSRTETAP